MAKFNIAASNRNAVFVHPNYRVLIMRTLRLQIGVIVTALALAPGAQSPRPREKDCPLSAPSSTSNTSSLATAATTNVTLRNELAWTFGGKQQRGWYLFDLLIGKTLNSSHDQPLATSLLPSRPGKKDAASEPDGILDEDALMAMVSQWQGNRLKSRTYATPDQLLTAPPSDFYDPSRAEELRQVERNAYAAYKEMVAAAKADPRLRLDGKYFKIVSAFRSREYRRTCVKITECRQRGARG